MCVDFYLFFSFKILHVFSERTPNCLQWCSMDGFDEPCYTTASQLASARPPTRLRYSQLRTKQPSRAKPTTTITTKRKKNILNHPFYKLILNHPFYKLILNHPFYRIILNHPFFFFRGLGYSLDFLTHSYFLR